MENADKYQANGEGLEQGGRSNLSFIDDMSRNRSLEESRNRILEEMNQYSYKSVDFTYYPKLLTMSLFFGMHRLTNGKIISGIIYALTGGGLCIWMFIDWITILTGHFTDEDGMPINCGAVISLANQLKVLEEISANSGR